MPKSNNQRVSNKINFVTQDDFVKIMQNTAKVATIKKIKNSKYKKMHQNQLSLLTYMKAKTQKSAKRSKCVGAKCTLNIQKFNNKHGKTREGGRKKTRTRLKKYVLLFRQLRQLSCSTKEYDEALQKFNELSLVNYKAKPQFEVTRNDVLMNEATNIPVEQNMMPVELIKNNSDSKKTIHSRRFRPYCDNCSITELATHTENLLRELNRFSQRAFAQNQIKACAHRRFVLGFREVQNSLVIKKIKLVIIATDCEDCPGRAGINDIIEKIKAQCYEQQIPCAFTMTRRQLAYALYKNAAISCVGILDYDGAREIFANVVEALQQARISYKRLVEN